MIAGVYALGGLLVIAGAISILSGVPVVQLEQGWTSVIAGSVAGSAGLLIVVLGLVLTRLRDIHGALERLAASGVTALATPARRIVPELPAEEPSDSPDESQPGLEYSVAASLADEKPTERRAQPTPPYDIDSLTRNASDELASGFPVAAGPFASRPTSALSAARPALLEEPAPYDLDVFEVAPPAIEEAHPPERDSRIPDLDEWRDTSDPFVIDSAVTSENTGRSSSAPAIRMGESPPPPLTPAQPKRPNILAKLFGRPPVTSTQTMPRTEPPTDPAVETILVPLREPDSPPAPARTSVDLSSGWGEQPSPSDEKASPEVAAADEPDVPAPELEAPSPATATADEPQAAEAEVFDLSPEPEPAPHPLRSPSSEAAEPSAAEPTILGRYTAGSASYVMYSDGTIEVETETGVHRFASMQELKEFIANQDASAV